MASMRLRRFAEPEAMQKDSAPRQRPNVWHQRRAQRVRCMPGLGAAAELLLQDSDVPIDEGVGGHDAVAIVDA